MKTSKFMKSDPYRRAKKSLGQNFLIDANYQNKIISSLGNYSDKNIIEIGPGRGALTRHLVDQSKSLTLFEKDLQLASDLKEKFGHQVQIYSGDFLDADLSKSLSESDYLLIANLPYNVSSQILIKLLENHQYFSDLFLMFQKEVALRLVAQADSKDYGLLSLWAQIYADTKLLFHLPPTVFKPQPKVYSSFVHLKIKSEPLLRVGEEKSFWSFVRPLFQHRRKTMRSLLRTYFPDKNYVLEDDNRRPGELSKEDFLELYRSQI